jgi:hypothetical protein
VTEYQRQTVSIVAGLGVNFRAAGQRGDFRPGWPAAAHTPSAAASRSRAGSGSIAVLPFDGVIPEIDIWRAANLMLKRYGEKALEESAARADELAADGDHNGVAVWRRIADAVTQLANKIPPGPVHQPAGKGSPIDCNPLDLVRRDLAPVWS